MLDLKHEMKGYNGGLVGERGLLIAMLIRARLDLDLTPPDVRAEATRFFLDTSNEPFSFYWICEHLEYSPKTLLKYLIVNRILFK